MKKIFFNILCIFLILFIFCVSGIYAYDYPKIIPYVNDFTNTLTPAQINALNQHADIIEKNTSYEIAVVLVNTTDGSDRLDYANHIGENNGVGKKETGAGLVVLWTFENERGFAIATARGSGEIYVNDAKAAEIARAARPLMEEGKYYEGLEQILTQLEQTIHERDTTATGTGNENFGISDDDLITILIIFGIVGLLIYFILSKIGYVSSFPSVRRRGGIISGVGFGGRGFGGGSFGGASFGGGGGRG